MAPVHSTEAAAKLYVNGNENFIDSSNEGIDDDEGIMFCDQLVKFEDEFEKLVTDFWLAINRQDISKRQSPVKLPSTDHARVVRVLIKYFHMYVYAGQHKQTSFVSENPYQVQMADMKRTSAFMVIRHKVLPYLKDCFSNWPLDGSFRMVLETWLSYIQPWRYTTLSETSLNESHAVDISQWNDFMKENVQFYTQLFSMFLNRAMRMEMKSSSSMQLVYRVAKVYSQSNFSAVLRQVLDEESDSPSQKLSSISANTSSGKLFATSIAHNNSSMFACIDGNKNIFDEPTLIQVQSLCECLASTCVELRRSQMRVLRGVHGNRLQSIWQQIKDFLMIDGNYYDEGEKEDDERRLFEYLEHSCNMLCHVFELPSFQTHPTPNISSTNVADEKEENTGLPSPNLHAEDDGKTPEFIMTKEGVKLTERGREQILRRERRFEFCESWDREYESVRSYESSYLLQLFQTVAIAVNEKLSGHLFQVYNRGDVISRTLRKISKEVENTRFLNCQIQIPRHRVDLREVRPRISLRFAASYYFVGYMFWTAVFLRLFGFSWLFIVSMMLIVLLIAIIVHVDSPPRIMQDE